MSRNDDRDARRYRRKLSRTPGLVERILGDPMCRAKGMLDLLKGRPATPALVRHAWAVAEPLARAIASLRGHSATSAERKAYGMRKRLCNFINRGVERNPHLRHLPYETVYPWPGWRDDLAKLAAARPEWLPGIVEDADYLAKLDAANKFAAEQAAYWEARANEGRALLMRLDPATKLANQMREAIDECVQQHASFADLPAVPPLSPRLTPDSPTAGSA